MIADASNSIWMGFLATRFPSSAGEGSPSRECGCSRLPGVPSRACYFSRAFLLLRPIGAAEVSLSALPPFLPLAFYSAVPWFAAFSAFSCSYTFSFAILISLLRSFSTFSLISSLQTCTLGPTRVHASALVGNVLGSVGAAPPRAPKKPSSLVYYSVSISGKGILFFCSATYLTVEMGRGRVKLS